MKQLLILSGKGGTGKTTVASAFIKLAEAKTYADCDVDAPNLHLITRHDTVPERKDYYGLPKAHIDPQVCVECDLCRQHCQFGAISVNDSYCVDQFACEGCAVCELVCPVGAVTLVPTVYGELMLYKDVDKVFSTAELKMGSGMSGMLVAEVKKQMKDAAVHKKSAIIDGSPGIGCPVIASLSGVDTVLVVTEPSISGISDMERVIDTALKFGTKVAVCVNKADANPELTEQIELFCEKEGLVFVGKIPYDPEAVRAINTGQSIVEIDCVSGTAVRDVYSKTMALLFNQEGDTDQ
ncbi:MAG TPA: ATP-binding protein [Clostridia bacterium]|nr:ATP-binding protein [Clostridia bacterium]